MEKVSVKVCLGTTCFVMGSANLQELIEMVPAKYGDKVEVSGVPCLGLCSIDWEFSKAPYVKVDDDVIKEIDRQAANTGSKKKDSSASSGDDGDSPADEMLPKAIEVVIEAQSASTTLLQRKLKLGYARAARIVEELEERGIIGPYEGAKPRKVLVSKQQWYEMNALAQGGANKPYGEDEEGQSEE